MVQGQRARDLDESRRNQRHLVDGISNEEGTREAALVQLMQAIVHDKIKEPKVVSLNDVRFVGL